MLTKDSAMVGCANILIKISEANSLTLEQKINLFGEISVFQNTIRVYDNIEKIVKIEKQKLLNNIMEEVAVCKNDLPTEVKQL